MRQLFSNLHEEIRRGQPAEAEPCGGCGSGHCPMVRSASPCPEALRAQAPFASAAALLASRIVSIEMRLDQVVVDRVIDLREDDVQWLFDKVRLYDRAKLPPAPRLSS